MDEDFFPIVYSSSDPYRNKMYDPRLIEIFNHSRPKGVTWYEFDVHIISPTKIKFVVFDMLDAVSGGKGREIYTVNATVQSIDTLIYCSERAIELAKLKRLGELKQAEQQIISEYAREILNSALNSS